MELKTKVIKFGNSTGVTIPTKIAKLIDLNINDEIIIKVNTDKTIEIKKI